MKTVVLALALLLFATAARAGGVVVLDAALAAELRQLAQRGAAAAGAAARVERIEVEVGRLDPRLALAPCDRIEPYLPPGTPLWGRSRVGLRCTAGVSKWNVFVPVTVKVFGRALVARTPLAAGTTLAAADWVDAEVNLAAEAGAVIVDSSRLAGRVLARGLPAGTALRDLHLRQRTWFAAGEPVRIVAAGTGWQVAGEGVALASGLEGANVRVRMASGRVVSGRPSGPRSIEVAL